MKNGRLYRIEDSGVQAKQAFRLGLSYQGKPIDFKLQRLFALRKVLAAAALTKLRFCDKIIGGNCLGSSAG